MGEIASTFYDGANSNAWHQARSLKKSKLGRASLWHRKNTGVTGVFPWLGDLDSNQDKQIQSLLSYR